MSDPSFVRPPALVPGLRPARVVGLVLAMLLAPGLVPLAAASGPRGPGGARDVPLAASTPALPAPPAEPKSNMGFRLLTYLDPTEGFCNHYLVAVPLFFGLGDEADSSLADPCSTTTGDGTLNADDVLCSWWTSRDGGMVVSRWDEPTQSWQSRTAWRDAATGDVHFAGAWTAPLVPGEAYAADVSAPDGSSLSNPVVIVGSHDPSTTGQPLSVPPGESRWTVLLNLPYHTMYWHLDEILCGLRDVDWVDGDADGWPDTCDGGIFDSLTGSRVLVGTFDDDPASPTADSYVWLSVRTDPATGLLVFEGVNDELVPGRAYLATAEAPHGGRTFLSPHF